MLRLKNMFSKLIHQKKTKTKNRSSEHLRTSKKLKNPSSFPTFCAALNLAFRDYVLSSGGFSFKLSVFQVQECLRSFKKITILGNFGTIPSSSKNLFSTKEFNFLRFSVNIVFFEHKEVNFRLLLTFYAFL